MNRVDEDKVKFFNQIAYAYERYLNNLKDGSGTQCTINAYNFCDADMDTLDVLIDGLMEEIQPLEED